MKNITEVAMTLGLDFQRGSTDYTLHLEGNKTFHEMDEHYGVFLKFCQIKAQL